MANMDIAARIAAAMQSDPKVNAAMTEWLDERYPVEISETITSAGVRDALRLMLAEARERADAQDRRLDRMSELIAHVVDRQDAADARFEAFMVEMGEMRAENNARFASIEQGLSDIRGQLAEHSDWLARLDRNMQRMGGRIGNMRGSDLDGELLKGCDRIMGDAFGCVESDVIWSARGGSAGMVGYLGRLLDARMRNARRRGQITTEQYKSLRSADLIARGRYDGGKPPVWVAVEASASIDMMDIDRAWDRAVILGALENVKAEGMVYGYSIPASMREYAQECGVSVIIADEP